MFWNDPTLTTQLSDLIRQDVSHLWLWLKIRWLEIGFHNVAPIIDMGQCRNPVKTRRCIDVVLMFIPRLRRWVNKQHQYYVCVFAGMRYLPRKPKRHWPNVVLMLTRRLRRRANIKTTLVQCIVFAGLGCVLGMSGSCRWTYQSSGAH